MRVHFRGVANLTILVWCKMAKPMIVTYQGERMTLTEVSKRCGIGRATLRSRVQNYGLSIEQAASTPVRKRSSGGGRPAANVPRVTPKLKRHPSGRAYSRWKMSGRTHERYFGAYGSKEAAEKYRRFASDWTAGKYDSSGAAKSETGRMTVAALASQWLTHCETYYVKDGEQTSEVKLCRAAVGLVADHCPMLPAAEFGPTELREIRDKLIGRDLARPTCNAYCGRIIRMFAWAAGRELIPPTTHAALALVEWLKPGRSAAPDRAKKKPATDDQIAATIPQLTPSEPERAAKMGAMIRLQRLTGMRPGEVCALSPAELDRLDGGVWRYEVGRANKNRHRGKAQVYYLGPKAVEILTPFLTSADPKQPVFGETAADYGHAIIRASAKTKCGRWSPHQLRHALATEVARQFRTLEHAAAAIGDSEAVAAAVYVHVDPRERAKIEVARAMG
jgi:integrase